MQTISVIGGTGELGGGLALRWAKAGIPVIIGSRDAERAQEAARKLGFTAQRTRRIGKRRQHFAPMQGKLVFAVFIAGDRPVHFDARRILIEPAHLGETGG